MTLFGIGPMELLVILVLALIVFGPNRLPEIARSIGKAVSELRRTSQEVTDTVMRELDVGGQPDEPPKTPAQLPQALQETVRKIVEVPPPREATSGGQMAAAGESAEEMFASPQNDQSSDEG